MAGRGLGLAALVALSAGCRVTGTFSCELDEQCRHGATTGRCEATQFCSLPDQTCDSGHRYDDNAGDGLASACVDVPPPMVDAGIDAPPFSIDSCPAGYTVSIASTTGTSRYRLVTVQGSYWQHAANCNDDLTGVTHLVVPNNAQEIVELSQYIDPLSNTGASFYVAAVQDPTAALPDAGWLLGNDVAVPAEVWLTGQPDDADGAENHAENVAYFDKSPSVRRMRDSYGGMKAGSVCECDGVPLGAMHQQFVDADPNNPN